MSCSPCKSEISCPKTFSFIHSSIILCFCVSYTWRRYPLKSQVTFLTSLLLYLSPFLRMFRWPVNCKCISVAICLFTYYIPLVISILWYTYLIRLFVASSSVRRWKVYSSTFVICVCCMCVISDRFPSCLSFFSFFDWIPSPFFWFSVHLSLFSSRDSVFASRKKIEETTRDRIRKEMDLRCPLSLHPDFGWREKEEKRDWNVNKTEEIKNAEEKKEKRNDRDRRKNVKQVLSYVLYPFASSSSSLGCFSSISFSISSLRFSSLSFLDVMFVLFILDFILFSISSLHSCRPLRVFFCLRFPWTCLIYSFHSLFLFCSPMTTVNLLARTIQGTYISEGGGFDYDQSWLCTM